MNDKKITKIFTSFGILGGIIYASTKGKGVFYMAMYGLFFGIAGAAIGSFLDSK